jgi:hypothetical protein
MRGFGSFGAAACFRSAHDNLSDHFRCRQHLNETVSLSEQRRLFKERWDTWCVMLRAASARSDRNRRRLTRNAARLRSEPDASLR